MKLTKETLKQIIKEELQATLREGLDEHDIVLELEKKKNIKKLEKLLAMEQEQAFKFIMDEYKTDRYTAMNVLSEIGYFQDEDYY
jgi:succinate dehydrogenase flavin-adding protein (antitoxin of CptAB toxin-antitoxin module)